MSKSRRALRRSHAERAKARVRKWWWMDDDPVLIGIHATTPKRCGKECGCTHKQKPAPTKHDAIKDQLDGGGDE